MIKPKASDSISAVSNPKDIIIEFICKECGSDIKPGPINCSKCNSTIIDGMDPVLNWIISKIIYTGIPTVVGLIIGLFIGKALNGFISGAIIGVLIATSVKRMVFKSQGIWALMRMGDSAIIEFYCPISTWEKGILPTLVYFSKYGGTTNLFKSQSQRLDEQERTIVKNIIDLKLKPVETNSSITMENEQKIQSANQSKNNGINEQKISPANQPEDNSIINITRLSKTRGSFDIFDVYVDNKKEIELKNGQTSKINIRSGDHTIRIQVQGWSFWSDTFTFSLATGETIYVSCIVRFNKGPLIERISDKKK
jgi:hypothetical protein